MRSILAIKQQGSIMNNTTIQLPNNKVRDIKFRAYHNKKMVYPNLIGRYESEFGTDYTLWGCDCEDVIPTTKELMQFTELKDKNGVDIYFDDVVYIAGYGKLHVNDLGDLVILVDALAENDIGIIVGNIHESPELIDDAL